MDVIVTITVPVPDDQANQGRANEIAEQIRLCGYSERFVSATARGVPYARNVTAYVDEPTTRSPADERERWSDLTPTIEGDE